MFLQFKYLLILFSIAKLPLKRKSSIRTNDSVSVQRDSARGSAGLFLTAYLNSKEIQNQKYMQMMHVLHADIFMIWGLHIQVEFSTCLALATLIRITSWLHHILDLRLNKHFWGWKACNLVNLLLIKALVNVLVTFLSGKSILKALGFIRKHAPQELSMLASEDDFSLLHIIEDLTA